MTDRQVRHEADPDTADARASAGGDAAAFERIYRRHVDRIHSLARRMVGPDDADEATQDVFVRAWSKLGTFRAEAAFGTWLHRLAINALLGWRTAEGRRRERIKGTDETLELLSGPTRQPELAMDFEAAIGHLPKGAREVFVLHDVEGFKHHEIAEMLGVTTGTSKAQLHRARTILRQHLDR